MRKSFEQSVETTAILAVFRQMRMSEQMTFADLSKKVGFVVTSSTSAYHSARKIAERDHSIFIGAIRKYGFFRGTGDDMADSLEPLANRMRKTAKRSIARADLAIRNNLSDEKYRRTVERRQRASIIFSTSSAPMPDSNRKRRPPAQEAPSLSPLSAIALVK